MNDFTLRVDQASTQLDQFEGLIGVQAVDGVLCLPMEFGTGQITCHAFPGGVHLYRYDVTLRQPLILQTLNRPDSDVFVLNFSVGGSPIQKSVGGADVTLQRNGPAGVLVYSPGVDTVSRPPSGFRSRLSS